MKKVVIAGFFSLLASVSQAMAWDAFVEGPDVFGTTKVLVTEGREREGMVIQCDSKGSFALGYIFRKKEFQEISEMPAALYIQPAKDAAPVKLTATFRSWNDNFGGVIVSDASDDVIAVIRSIGQAKGKIGVGYEVGSQQWSAEFSSRGSTGAIGKLLKGCALEAGKLPPA